MVEGADYVIPSPHGGEESGNAAAIDLGLATGGFRV
jgi:hypothetical protein